MILKLPYVTIRNALIGRVDILILYIKTQADFLFEDFHKGESGVLPNTTEI